MFFSSVSKYIIKMNKNNACIYNYTGVYYFLSKEGMTVELDATVLSQLSDIILII